MKKRLLSLLLIFSLLSGLMILPGYAASASDSSEASKILSDLGIIDNVIDESLPITRGEFASAIAGVMNVDSLPGGYVLPYSDVASGSKHYDGVYNLYAWRAISASEFFRPDDAIGVAEAYKIAISLLGYDFLATAAGGYPNGYVNAANQLGITPHGVGAQFTAGNAYELMFNMLDTNLPGVAISGDGNNNYYVGGGDKLIFDRWNIEVVSGMITDGQRFGINKKNGAGDGFFAVDGFSLKNGGFDTDSLFGDEVDAYYDVSTKELRAIYSRPSDDGKNVKIYSNQNIRFKRGTYTYLNEKEEDEEIKISFDATVIYNGQNVRYDEDIMNPKNGYVKLLSVNSSDVNVVIIKSYTEMVVATKNDSDFLVSDKMNEGVSYILDNEYITYSNQDGAVCEFKDIKENDILWISQTRDGEINEVRICSDVIAGEYTGYSGNSVYIDDRSYEVSESALNDVQNNYQMGSVLRGCINPDGKIVYFVAQKSSDSTTVGYLMYSRLSSRGLYSAASVKFLGTDGLTKEFTISDALTVNGRTFKGTAAEIYANLPKQVGNEKSMVASIVVYNADRSDRLISVVYPDDVAIAHGFEPYGLYKNGEVIDTTGDGKQYIQYKSSDRALYSVGTSRIFPASSMVRFQVPNPQNASDYEDKDYKIAGFPSSNNVTGVNHYGYTTIEGQVQSDYVVAVFSDVGGSAGEHGDSQNLLLVTDVSQVINNEGDEVERIQVARTNGTTEEYYSSEMGYFSKIGIKFGDIVKINADAKKMVTGITAFYQGPDKDGKDMLCTNALDVAIGHTVQQDGALLTSNTGMNSLAGSVILLGTVYASDGLVIKLLTANYDPETFENESVLRGFSMYGKNIVYCDLKTETVSTLTAGELKSYLAFGKNCHKAVIQTYSGTVNSVYVYAY